MNHHVWHHTGRAAAIGALVGCLLLVGAGATGVAAASCVSTGALDRDGTPLTARLVNPAGPVKGKVDATGCSVGVYFDHGTGKVQLAEIFGANYYGVLVDGNVNPVAVDVVDSLVHDIGETPITSSRHGEGVAYRSFNGGSATGSVRGNRVWNFQEAGINMTGPGSTVTAIGNRVIGRGPEGVVSQNGIQVIFGAHGRVTANAISDLQFTGPNTGNGILIVGGPSYGMPYTRDARVELNSINAADVGIVVFELDPDYNPPSSPTNTLIAGNVVRNAVLSNVAGWDGVSVGHQAGISVDGNGDRVIGNVILGQGYHQDFCGTAAICLPIDTDVSIDPILRGNLIR